MGSGSLGPLSSYIDIYSLDAVLISHLHPDHFFDLAGYYVARKYRPSGPAPLVPVFGPEGTGPRVARAYGLPTSPGMTREFEFRSLVSRTFEVGPFTVTTAAMQHPIASYAMRVEAGGKTLVYSGDTGPCEELAELAAGADVALFEASFLESEDNPTGLHMTGRDAAEAASKAGAGRLILTHLVPWNDSDEILEEAVGFGFEGDVSLATAGMLVEV